MKTKIFNYFLLSVVVLFLSSCSRTKEMSYQEEVQLSNGEVIIVKRTYDVTFFSGYDEWLRKVNDIYINKQRIEIVSYNDITNKIPIWINDTRASKEKIYGLDTVIPLILDKNESEEWIMIVTHNEYDCGDFHSDFPYRQYKAVNGKWERVRFDKNIFGKKRNLEYIKDEEIKEDIISSKRIATKLLKLSDKPYYKSGYFYKNKGYFLDGNRYDKIMTINELLLSNDYNFITKCKGRELNEYQVMEQEQWLPDNYVPLAITKEKNESGELIKFIMYSENWGDTLAKKWAGMPVSELINKLDEQNKEQSK